MSAKDIMMAAASGAPVQEGGITLAIPGTHSLVIPAGVTSVAAIAIGGGGGGGGTSSAATSSAAGGGGGALSYSNTISVTPGETLTVVVGQGGTNGTTAGTTGTAGGDSYIRRSSTDLLLAKGGGGGGGNTGTSTGGAGTGGAAASGVGDTKNSGGNGGARNSNDRGGGGGGAAGYSDNGGTGGQGTTNPTAGAGGGGGGGYFGYTGSVIGSGGGGGGVQFYGSGSNGVAGVQGSSVGSRNGGLGSSQGSTAGGAVTSRFPGGGGGGAASDGLGSNGVAGRDGSVRILWGGTKSFPSTGVTTNTISLFASASSDASTITVPSGVQPGDFMVLFDIAFGSSSPSLVIPSGFTEATNRTGSNGRIAGSYKQVLSASDAGTTLTGMNGTTSNNKILLVFRGTNGYGFGDRSYATSNANISNSNLSSTDIGASPIDSYAQGITVTACAFYGSNGIDPSTDITFSGATFVQGASNVFYAGYKIYTQADTNTQTTGITAADKGTNGWMLGLFLGY